MPWVTQLAQDRPGTRPLVRLIGQVQEPSPAPRCRTSGAWQGARLSAACTACGLGNDCRSLLGIDGFLSSLARLRRAPWLGFNYTIEKTNKLKEEPGSVNSFFNDSEDQACLSPGCEHLPASLMSGLSKRHLQCVWSVWKGSGSRPEWTVLRVTCTRYSRRAFRVCV